MDFYPAGLFPPDELITPEFILRPLRTTDFQLDYDAVMENPAALRLSGGGNWPADDFGLEANLSDLARHENEHKEGIAFTFTMMNVGQDECLGCVYVNQLTSTYRIVETSGPERFDQQQAVVRFWVRQSRIKDDLDWHLVRILIVWFSEAWNFSKVYLRAHEDDKRQRFLMTKAALPLRLTLELPGRNGRFLAFGPLGASNGEESR